MRWGLSVLGSLPAEPLVDKGFCSSPEALLLAGPLLQPSSLFPSSNIYSLSLPLQEGLSNITGPQVLHHP